jgi:hypothetical protein
VAVCDEVLMGGGGGKEVLRERCRVVGLELGATRVPLLPVSPIHGHFDGCTRVHSVYCWLCLPRRDQTLTRLASSLALKSGYAVIRLFNKSDLQATAQQPTARQHQRWPRPSQGAQSFTFPQRRDWVLIANLISYCWRGLFSPRGVSGCEADRTRRLDAVLLYAH